MQTAIPEYMKVRAYLFKLVMNSDGKSLKIPSENELCRLFNVSRITVRGAIKGLVDDKFLVTRRGIGTFINYDKIKNQTLQWPVIGFLIGDCKNAINTFDSVIAESIVQSGMNFELLYLPESNKLETFMEIAKHSLDGLIWQKSNINRNNLKYIEALQKADKPLLLIEEATPPVSCDFLLSNRYQRGKTIADYLHSKGHQKILFIHNDESNEEHYESSSTYKGFCQHMTERCKNEWGDIKNNIVKISDLSDKLNNNNDFSGIYSGNYIVPSIVRELNARSLAIPGDLSYLVFNSSNPFFFNGLKPDIASENDVLQNTVIEWLNHRITEADKSGTFIRNIDLKITPGETVKRRTC
jgi:GntR family transcriptional regulator, arabinose operon transcriptional repressor